MEYRKTLLTAVLLAAASLAPQAAQARVDVDINIGPPAPPVVVVPPPRVGYVWTPGYYFWDGNRHIQHDGRWLRERRGQHWREDYWEQRGDRWHRVPGHWERG